MRPKFTRFIFATVLLTTVGWTLADSFQFPSLRPARSQRPVDTQRLMSAAELFERQGRLERAARLYAEVCRRSPEHTVARIRLAAIQTILPKQALPKQALPKQGVLQQDVLQQDVLADGEYPVADAVRSPETEAPKPRELKPEKETTKTIDVTVRNNEARDSRIAFDETSESLSRIRTAVDDATESLARIRLHRLPESSDVDAASPTAPRNLLGGIRDRLARVGGSLPKPSLPPLPKRPRTPQFDPRKLVAQARESLSRLMKRRPAGGTRRESNDVQTAGATDPVETAAIPAADSSSLVGRLADGDVEIRRSAAMLAMLMGDDARSIQSDLFRSLTDADPVVRCYVAGILCRVGHERELAIAVLTHELASRDNETVMLACYLLGKCGSTARSALPGLESQLNRAADPGLQLHAAEAIVRIDGTRESARNTLRGLLKNPDAQVRWLAAFAMQDVGAVERGSCVKELVAALGDDDARVRSASALTLGGYGADAREAVSVLRRQADGADADAARAATIALMCIASSEPPTSSSIPSRTLKP